MNKLSSHMFSFAKDYPRITHEWLGAPFFGRYGRMLVSKPAISFEKNWGASVERLDRGITFCLKLFLHDLGSLTPRGLKYVI